MARRASSCWEAASTRGLACGPARRILNESGDRMAEAVRLAARYPSLPVFFSGGKGELSPAGGVRIRKRRSPSAFSRASTSLRRGSGSRTARGTRSRTRWSRQRRCGRNRGRSGFCHLGLPHATGEGAFRGAGLRGSGTAGGFQDERLRWLVASISQGSRKV